MCALFRAATEDKTARSLGLVRPADVSELSEQSTIDAYVNQMQLFSEDDRTPLEAPRFHGRYRWRCQDQQCKGQQCKGHEQGMLDSESVALQQNLRGRSDDELKAELRTRFLENPFGSAKDPAILVGNLAKPRSTFMVLGLYQPNKSD